MYTDRLCRLVVRVFGYSSRGHAFDSRHYQILWEVVGLERSPLSLVSTIEELLWRKSSSSGLDNREYIRTDPSLWQRDIFDQQTLALTSLTSGSRSVGIICLRTEATELSLTYIILSILTEEGCGDDDDDDGESCIMRSFIICTLRKVY
jgi:hypothetical protein